MKITLQTLRDLDACEEVIQMLKENFGESAELPELIEWAKQNINKKGVFENIVWLYTKINDKIANVKLTIHCAKLALPIWEKHCPDDKSMAETIDLAEKWLADPTEENRKAAADAACRATYDAVAAVYAARNAAHAAGVEAYVAAGIAYLAFLDAVSAGVSKLEILEAMTPL
jgi:hypothetical protein